MGLRDYLSVGDEDLQSDLSIKIGKQISAIRQHRRLNYTDVSELSNVMKDTISAIENGNAYPMFFRQLERILEVLGCDINISISVPISKRAHIIDKRSKEGRVKTYNTVAGARWQTTIEPDGSITKVRIDKKRKQD